MKSDNLETVSFAYKGSMRLRVDKVGDEIEVTVCLDEIDSLPDVESAIIVAHKFLDHYLKEECGVREVKEIEVRNALRH